eukprot:7923237-Lingulodinium_polyedra.AAC.1
MAAARAPDGAALGERIVISRQVQFVVVEVPAAECCSCRCPGERRPTAGPPQPGPGEPLGSELVGQLGASLALAEASAKRGKEIV